LAAQHPGAAREIAPEALHKLGRHDWPGNVRELENVLERAALLCRTGVIQSGGLELPTAGNDASEPESFRALKARVVAEFERNHVRNLLALHGGNIARAARASQKNRRVFFQLMRKHHIRVERIANANGEPLVKIVIAAGPKDPSSLRP
jgi:two-component system response regulator GlrR